MIEGNQSPVQKFVYFLGNLVCLGLAVYKCQVMGLLPTHASDWLAFVEPLKVIHGKVPTCLNKNRNTVVIRTKLVSCVKVCAQKKDDGSVLIFPP